MVEKEAEKEADQNRYLWHLCVDILTHLCPLSLLLYAFEV